MRRYAVEFIGTFFLVLTVGCTGLAETPGVIAPLAIGSVLMAMIYAGGHISGAHYNPAVTLGVFLRGRCPASDVLPYWGAQLLGAAGAAGVIGLALRGAPASSFLPPVVGAFLPEFLFTFALVYVVLNVATAKATDGIPISVSLSASRSWLAHSPSARCRERPSTRPSPSAPRSWASSRDPACGSTSLRNCWQEPRRRSSSKR
jgi:glycerol uptake facilitator-like aquaporin